MMVVVTDGGGGEDCDGGGDCGVCYDTRSAVGGEVVVVASSGDVDLSIGTGSSRGRDMAEDE